MVVSRQEVQLNLHELQKNRQEELEDILREIVPEIDKKLLSLPENKFPVNFEISKYVAEWPELATVLNELYSEAGWIVKETYYRESEDSYGDGKGKQHDYVTFYLD
ncbi:MAG: hypothetical protein ABIM96_04770 [Candidatus Saccharimonas sp.]